ncbi:protein TIFY 9-like isoform X2 [Hibiscus syriacus]|uniref:protein TIFY 9-like isoform X2 n=1 Tax=Hibiscus syriacus TaxID=106335 RepID=UPI0019205ADA|nr:protein TIFY 9-like isoform X2 [Hibiscus syriacus]
MSRATVELDFFGMEKADSCKSQFQKFLDRRRSFRSIQGTISKMNPELIKSMISSGSTNRNPVDWRKSFSVPSSPKENRSSPIPSLPILNPALSSSEGGPETAPLTIFYNGTVSVFNVPRDKVRLNHLSKYNIHTFVLENQCIESCDLLNFDQVKSIFKLAVELEGSSKNVESTDSSKVANPSNDRQNLLETRNGDLPIARRKSLQRFLEKRKERLTCASPYAW